jgi:hypothetical protein
MASTATIILTGVVYLAHLPQASPPVLRVAITQSQHDMVSTRGGAIPHHRPFISVKASDLDSSKSDSADLVVQATGKQNRSIYFLANDTVTIAGHTDKTLKVPTTVTAPDVPFTSVLKLDDFCPTCRPFQQADFDTPNSDHVGGRIDITAGTVVARSVSDCTAWHFDAEPGYPAHTQAVTPRAVAVTLDTPKGLVLTLKPFATGGKTRTITMKPNTSVEVMIGSATIEDVLEIGTTHMAPDRVDHHFELFYHLLMRSNAAKHPLPVADASCAARFRPNGVDCPPVQQ